jgi:hypothetical protein
MKYFQGYILKVFAEVLSIPIFLTFTFKNEKKKTRFAQVARTQLQDITKQFLLDNF